MKKLLPIGYRWLATGIGNTEVTIIHANDPTQKSDDRSDHITSCAMHQRTFCTDWGILSKIRQYVLT